MDAIDSTASLKNKTPSIDGSAPVAFFDSGVGGLPYLRWAKENIPGETYVYLLDRAHFPYGIKSKEEVFQAVSESIDRLIKRVHPKIVVLACNTATVIALKELRLLFPDTPFVGVVPAVKPAAERTRGKRIGVMATNRTLQDTYLDNLIKQFASNCEVVRVADPEIVSFVEQRLFESNREERSRVIQEAARVLREQNVDEVVLACTHFLYLEEELRDALGKEIGLLDSREGVGRQLKRILETNSVPNLQPKGRDLMYLTGTEPIEQRYFTFARMFGLEVGGTL
jgi:glutamate racemase